MSFVDFIDDYLLNDPSQDLRILLTAMKGLKLIFHPEEKNLGNRVNMRKLVTSLVYKLNDSKEIIRNEVEQMIIELQTHMHTKHLILQIVACFEQQRLTDLGKRQMLQLVMILLLKHEQES